MFVHVFVVFQCCYCSDSITPQLPPPTAARPSPAVRSFRRPSCVLSSLPRLILLVASGREVEFAGLLALGDLPDSDELLQQRAEVAQRPLRGAVHRRRVGVVMHLVAETARSARVPSQRLLPGLRWGGGTVQPRYAPVAPHR
jgi:hypothetical protein